MKFTIQIHFTLFLFTFFNVSSREFKVTYVARGFIFLLDDTYLERFIKLAPADG